MTNPTTRAVRTLAVAALSLLALTLTTAATAADDPAAIAATAFDQRLAGDVDQAVATLEAGLEANPDAGILHYELARTRMYLLEIDPMLEAAEAAVQSDPTNNEYRYFAAMAAGYGLIDAAHQQDTERMRFLGERCFDHLEANLANNPSDNRSRCLLVEMHMNMAPEIGYQVEGTEEHVALLERNDPVLGAKARAALAGEDASVDIWKKLVAQRPEDCRALAEAADGLVAAGELALAQDCLDKAIGKNKQHCYGLLRLGLAYAMRGDTEAALALTDRYLATDPPVALRAFAIGRKGVLQRRSGDREQGDLLMAEARALDPHVWLTVMPPPREIFTSL
jgi:tetratricopeptide (TPR) repeat protein